MIKSRKNKEDVKKTTNKKKQERRQRTKMGILQNIRNKLPTLRHDNTQYTQLTNYLHPITTTTNTEIYHEAMQNVDVHVCLQTYKNTALACDFNIDSDTIENDDTLTNNYLERLFHQPEGYNSFTSWSDTNSLIWDSTLAMGDCFFEISTDPQYNVFNGFKYIHNEDIMWNNENDCFALRYQPDVFYEPDELIHIKQPNPRRTRSVWGVSKINICADWIALSRNALRFNNDLLLNDGLDPNTILSYDKDVPDKNFVAELKRLSAEKQAAKQSGKKTLMAVKGATVQSNIRSNRDMNYLELLKFARDQIIRTFQVPPQLAGIIETASLGSGSGDSQKKDWKNTFDGAKACVENAFNNTLKHHGFQERFHYQALDVIDEMYDAQVNQIYLNTGVYTIDEVRNTLGLDKMTRNNWGDYYR